MLTALFLARRVSLEVEVLGLDHTAVLARPAFSLLPFFSLLGILWIVTLVVNNLVALSCRGFAFDGSILVHLGRCSQNVESLRHLSLIPAYMVSILETLVKIV